VGIVAILEKQGGPELLLQKQYRPPIDKICIEVPAGLVDAGETAETCAVRELKEETGYVGKVLEGGLGKTPIMFNGKWQVASSLQLYYHLSRRADGCLLRAQADCVRSGLLQHEPQHGPRISGHV